ncbi:MAG: class I SAM-dependent methyltransferase [Dyella sp.]|uniref:class I SAM-dependent methyltransferase n=1 Tax=Dyella sp. TaxID=1869338 RepID=UPI003F7E36D9
MQNNQPLISGPGGEFSGQQRHEDFYRAFEDRFRGSRELILSRLQVYLPFINPLKQISSELPAVDLGCGRGEWLELLKENGFDGQGVDLDAGMLRSCHERNLRAIQGDVIEFLRKLPSESQLIVSGFHIAEHLPFEQLQTLVAEALRVLRPAGLLILETPNPENFKVSSVGFYMDPSHRNPLPPELLAFVPEYYGFARVKIARLQENSALLQAKGVSLDQVLGGASPDYAVVAQKQADVSLLGAFDGAFKQEYGLPVSALLDSYDRSKASFEAQILKLFGEEGERIDRMQMAIVRLADQCLRAEAQIQKLFGEEGKRIESMRMAIVRLTDACLRTEAQLQQFSENRKRIDELGERVSHLEYLNNPLMGMQAAIEHVHERLAFADNVHAALLDSLNRERVADARLQRILRSRSWRITKGPRFVVRVLRAAMKNERAAGLKLKDRLVRFIIAAAGRPVLRRIGGTLLSIAPRLKVRLIRAVVGNARPETTQFTPPAASNGSAHLPARARTVRSMLNSIMKSS